MKYAIMQSCDLIEAQIEIFELITVLQVLNAFNQIVTQIQMPHHI